MRDLCAAQPGEEARPLANYSETILPGQSEVIDGLGDASLFSHPIDNLASEREVRVREAEDALRALGGTPHLSSRPSQDDKVFYVELALAGCVTYKVPGDKQLHSTGFSFDARNGIYLVRVDAGKKGTVFDGPLQISKSAVGNFAD